MLCVYVHIYTHIYLYMYMHTCMYICVCACVHAHVHKLNDVILQGFRNYGLDPQLMEAGVTPLKATQPLHKLRIWLWNHRW